MIIILQSTPLLKIFYNFVLVLNIFGSVIHPEVLQGAVSMKWSSLISWTSCLCGTLGSWPVPLTDSSEKIHPPYPPPSCPLQWWYLYANSYPLSTAHYIDLLLVCTVFYRGIRAIVAYVGHLVQAIATRGGDTCFQRFSTPLFSVLQCHIFIRDIMRNCPWKSGYGQRNYWARG